MPDKSDTLIQPKVVGRINNQPVFMDDFSFRRDHEHKLFVKDGNVTSPNYLRRQSAGRTSVFEELVGLTLATSLLNSFTGTCEVSIRDYVQSAEEDEVPGSYLHRDGEHFPGLLAVAGVANAAPTIMHGLPNLEPWDVYLVDAMADHEAPGQLEHGANRRFVRAAFFPED